MKGKFLSSGYASPQEEAVRCWEYDTGKGVLAQRWSVTGLNSPTYLALHPGGRVFYSGEKHEGEGFLVTYHLSEDRAEIVSRLPSGGMSPCHLSLDEKAEFLFLSNYQSGSISVFRLDGEGLPLERTCVRQHRGGSVRPQRQEGPHVHCGLCLGEEVLVCDLGQDIVFCYRLDRETGTLWETSKNLLTQPGDGPRHLAVHPARPGLLYLITELTGKVCVYRRKGEKYALIHRLSALPEDFSGENTAAALRFNGAGTLLLASNRGHDSIAVFAVKPDGTLEEPVFSSSGGGGPRDINLNDNLVISSNQYTGDIVLFTIDQRRRLVPIPGCAVKGGQPTCILPL